MADRFDVIVLGAGPAGEAAVNGLLHGGASVAMVERELIGGELEAKNVIVATGSDPVIPPLEGLEEAGYWTNREASSLHEIPESAVVLGGGPVGVELGQFLSRYGCRVTLVHKPD